MGPRIEQTSMRVPTEVDESQLLSLPFDHYQRHHLTQRIVSILWPERPNGPLRILDVGGSSSSLKHFQPDDEVVLVDMQAPPAFTYREGIPFLYNEYLLGAGGHLPFADESFDLVTAHDTLEHVPAESRGAFLRDLARVSRRYIIVNGPVYHTETEQAEQRWAFFMERAFGGSNPSLDEHIELGLPHKSTIDGALEESGLAFVSVPNGNLYRWLFMMALKHYILAFPDGARPFEELDSAYNLLLSASDFGGVCYREAYVIAKHQGDAPCLQQVNEAFPQEASESAPGVEALEALLASLEEHAGAVRSTLDSQRTELSELRGALDVAIERETELARLNAEKEVENARLAAVVAEHEGTIAGLAGELGSIRASIGYRVLLFCRRIIRPPIRWLAPPGTRRRGALLGLRGALNLALSRNWKRMVKKLVRVWEWPRIVRTLSQGSLHSLDVDTRYQLWRQRNAVTDAKARGIRRTAGGLAYRPKISIIIPVYNPEPNWLRDAIESVRAQLYDNWQLCIADDASTKAGVRELLQECERDARVKVVYQPQNQGISSASNAALALADGEYVAFLDHDDELSPDALYEVVKLLNDSGERDFIYSDEDKRDTGGALISPFFKPDWSPDLEYSSNYVTHFSVYRREVVERAGGFRKGFDGSQDYDLALRVTELTDRIAHIRKVLYTWRMVPGSAAASSEAKPYAYEAAKRALTESLGRRGIDGWVEEGETMGWYRIRYRIAGQPLVSAIIPTRDRADLLANCLDKIRDSSYKRIEIVVVDNGSIEEATHALLDSPELTVIRDAGDFNFSRLINAGAAAATGDYMLLLNNDVEAINEDWIEAMLEHAQRPEVGVVGARLLYPTGKPQHEGVALGIGGTFAGHVDWRDYLGLSHAVRNCSAVTAAAALTRRSVFEELDGFDESFRVAYGDVDYCLRARERGYLVVYTPYAVLYHHESASRGSNHPPEDEVLARRRWGHLTDPYYNYALDEVLQPWVYAPVDAASETSHG